MPIAGNPPQAFEPDLPPIHRGDAEDRKIGVTELILIKKKWDNIDAQFQELRDQGRILPGIRENAKANMILEVERGVSCYESARLHAPGFLRKGRSDEMFFVNLPDAPERAQIRDVVIIGANAYIKPTQ